MTGHGPKHVQPSWFPAPSTSTHACGSATNPVIPIWRSLTSNLRNFAEERDLSLPLGLAHDSASHLFLCCCFFVAASWEPSWRFLAGFGNFVEGFLDWCFLLCFHKVLFYFWFFLPFLFLCLFLFFFLFIFYYFFSLFYIV